MLRAEVSEKDTELHTLRKSVKSLTVEVEREGKAAAAAKQQQAKVSCQQWHVKSAAVGKLPSSLEGWSA